MLFTVSIDLSKLDMLALKELHELAQSSTQIYDRMADGCDEKDPLSSAFDPLRDFYFQLKQAAASEAGARNPSDKFDAEIRARVLCAEAEWRGDYSKMISALAEAMAFEEREAG